MVTITLKGETKLLILIKHARIETEKYMIPSSASLLNVRVIVVVFEELLPPKEEEELKRPALQWGASLLLILSSGCEEIPAEK